MFKFRSKKERAILLLKDVAATGDLQAQQMLNLYEAFEAQHTPIYDSIAALTDSKSLDDLIQCLKKANNPTDDK